MIALVDYGAGNTASVSNVLKQLNADFILSNDKQVISNSEKVILPGVGEASSAMRKLKELDLIVTLKSLSKPFLGICLGMQLMCEKTDEGNAECLGLIPVGVKRFDDLKVKVPHMGWNQIGSVTDRKLLNSINEQSYFYFAHSFYVPLNKFTTSVCNYAIDFSSSVRYINFFGVQFHPEKSAVQGIQIIKNFIIL